MRTVKYAQLAALLITVLPANAQATEKLLFQFEQQAQQHCPSDSVVWADPALHLYNVKGERWYGATKGGAYLCLRDGEKQGYHARRAAVSAGAE